MWWLLWLKRAYFEFECYETWIFLWNDKHNAVVGHVVEAQAEILRHGSDGFAMIFFETFTSLKCTALSINDRKDESTYWNVPGTHRLVGGWRIQRVIVLGKTHDEASVSAERLRGRKKRECTIGVVIGKRWWHPWWVRGTRKCTRTQQTEIRTRWVRRCHARVHWFGTGQVDPMHCRHFWR